jgi:hypothetical protein
MKATSPPTCCRFVQEVTGDSVWCVFSPLVRGRAFLAHAAAELEQQQQLQQQQGAAGAQDLLQARFKPGQPIKVIRGVRPRSFCGVAGHLNWRRGKRGPGTLALHECSCMGGIPKSNLHNPFLAPLSSPACRGAAQHPANPPRPPPRPPLLPQAHVVEVDNAKRWMEVSLVGPRSPPRVGQVALGRVVAADGAGVRVQVGGHSVGKVRPFPAPRPRAALSCAFRCPDLALFPCSVVCQGVVPVSVLVPWKWA